VKYLVDANVLSEPTRADPSPLVLRWLEAHEHELCIDAIILGEVRYGILLLAPGRRRDRLEGWFASGVHRIACLAWEPPVGLRWATLLAELKRQGLAMPVKDSQIAATALHHGLTVATRNVRDFAKAGAATVNPFERET
jgi:predicted nucleic acid-binding protein